MRCGEGRHGNTHPWPVTRFRTACIVRLMLSDKHSLQRVSIHSRWHEAEYEHNQTDGTWRHDLICQMLVSSVFCTSNLRVDIIAQQPVVLASTVPS